MIDSLFSQPDYVGAKKALDVAELRQQALSSNIANLETPGYKRVDIAPTFNQELAKACASQDSEQISSLSPQLAVDVTAKSVTPDGNNVNLEGELIKMNQNMLAHAVETQMVSYQLARLKMAINGKSA